jgi:alpha-tubulin suppressor-like RCC1 family protein
MIPINPLANNINQAIVTGGSNDLKLNQLAQSSIFLESNAVFSVANTSLLPLPSRYQGVLLYVTSENRYYYSDGLEWRLDYSSVYAQPSNVLYTWGGNYSGRLGDGTTTSKSSPVTVVGGITNWRRISTSELHRLGVTTTGTLYSWGYNAFGQLGDGTNVGKSSPVTVVGGITTWSQVSAGRLHSIGLTSTGVLYGWGSGSGGGLGDNTTSNRSSPVTVVGGITTWSKIAATDGRSLGITTAGILYSWGNNGVGGLGDNTIISRLSPVTVVGGITTWSQIAGGRYHTVAATSAGIAYAWGLNSSGELGDNTAVSSRSSPVAIVGNITNWSQVSGGSRFCTGLTATGIAYAWGQNIYGRLGDNTTSGRSSPVTVVGGITNWQQLSSAPAGEHSMGLTINGTLYTWGRNLEGVLGNNTTNNTSSPVTVVGGITSWAAISDHGSGMALSTPTTLDVKGFI